MAYTVKLTKTAMAAARRTAELRPKNVRFHVPATDPNADLHGAMAEHAWVQHHKLRHALVGTDAMGVGGDGGVDFHTPLGTLDIKASSKHPTSWLVPGGPLRAEWYVFATVVPPDTVIFKGKATAGQLSRIKPVQFSEGSKVKRLVYLAEVDDIDPEDFRGGVGR